jgi:cytochrome c biogenesis protein CcmG, thiol:disulfide interchange protein DsbE
MTVRRLLFLLPALAFLAISVGLAIGLTRDPSTLPSALLDRPAPEFDLPPLPGRAGEGLSTADLRGNGVSLVNVFASWCGPCRVEHPVLDRLAEEGVTINAINYKDRPEAARAFLAELGDPYGRVGFDETGRVAIDWGVYGVPETFVVDADGTIVYRHVGPLMPRDADETIRPLLEELRG